MSKVGEMLYKMCFSFNFPKADCDYRGQHANRGETFQVKGECNVYTCQGPGEITAKTYVAARLCCSSHR